MNALWPVKTIMHLVLKRYLGEFLKDVSIIKDLDLGSEINLRNLDLWPQVSFR